MRVILNQTQWSHFKISGSDRANFLNGMVSGNIKTMKPGDWLRTLMLTHKARIVSIFELSAFDDHFVLSCQPELADKTIETLDKHIVMDDVEIDACSMAMHTVWDEPHDVWTAKPVFSTSAEASSMEEIECMRIEAGLPRYGVDVDESNFPFESPLVRLVDYQKGCFTGQEPVARVQARGGGGSKKLLGLVARGGLLPQGASISTPDKAEAGEIRSVTMSERFGSIALAYVHKSAWEAGTEVAIGDRQARVSHLPFSRS